MTLFLAAVPSKIELGSALFSSLCDCKFHLLKLGTFCYCLRYFELQTISNCHPISLFQDQLILREPSPGLSEKLPSFLRSVLCDLFSCFYLFHQVTLDAKFLESKTVRWRTFISFTLVFLISIT